MTWLKINKCVNCKDKKILKMIVQDLKWKSKWLMTRKLKKELKRISGWRNKKKWFSLRITWEIRKKRKWWKIMKIIWEDRLNANKRRINKIRDGINSIGILMRNCLENRKSMSRSLCCHWKKRKRKNKKKLWRN